ncbi:MAG: sulfocyanin-like copper-binding protein [Acidimicrobiales bacterium]
MKTSRWLTAAVALAVGAGGGALGMGLVASGSSAAPGVSAAPGNMTGPATGSTGMMGGADAMMGGGSDVPGGASGGLVSASRMASLAAAAARTVNRSGSTLNYQTQQVTIVAVGAPGNRPGMYWQVDGIDKPAITIPAGSTVTVEFADGDRGHPHGFELTTASPPYPRMAMMAGQVASPGAFIMPVPPPDGNLWYSATTTFRAPAPGTYHIICPVPGHAQKGMWTKFVVR